MSNNMIINITYQKHISTKFIQTEFTILPTEELYDPTMAKYIRSEKKLAYNILTVKEWLKQKKSILHTSAIDIEA